MFYLSLSQVFVVMFRLSTCFFRRFKKTSIFWGGVLFYDERAAMYICIKCQEFCTITVKL